MPARSVPADCGASNLILYVLPVWRTVPISPYIVVPRELMPAATMFMVGGSLSSDLADVCVDLVADSITPTSNNVRKSQVRIRRSIITHPLLLGGCFQLLNHSIKGLLDRIFTFMHVCSQLFNLCSYALLVIR